MKKLLSFTFICITTSILFYSCSSHLSITKRHFNKGYYVSHSNGPQNASLLKEEKTVQTSQQLPLDSAQYQSKSNTITESPEKYLLADNTALATNNKKLPRKAISRNNINKAIKQIVKIPESNTVQIKSPYSEKKITGSDSSKSDELSLLWVVVLVILILWLLGFLAGGFGLGGLINLLLLVALILFILWLLRVI